MSRRSVGPEDPPLWASWMVVNTMSYNTNVGAFLWWRSNIEEEDSSVLALPASPVIHWEDHCLPSSHIVQHGMTYQIDPNSVKHFKSQKEAVSERKKRINAARWRRILTGAVLWIVVACCTIYGGTVIWSRI